MFRTIGNFIRYMKDFNNLMSRINQRNKEIYKKLSELENRLDETIKTSNQNTETNDKSFEMIAERIKEITTALNTIYEENNQMRPTLHKSNMPQA